ncbi:hypothetical protein Mic7113_6252 [Allocoleopsis franciscana PCC 7113]|uniref:Uncharacterized protein n=1 Tax=Allocoleopsis franciscana PCC 7113 TaxID=1173027 RepID=K9WQK0_9CYAN|nr:hypothetical protein Mic7113_6252 [Allocoleopsis franciscana PCC 7113]
MTKLMQGKAETDVLALPADWLYRKQAGYNACHVLLGKP